MSMPAKKSTRSKTSVRVKSDRRRSPEVSTGTETREHTAPLAATETSTEVKDWHGKGWIALALASVAAAAMLIAAPGPSRPVNTAAAGTSPDKRAEQPTMSRAGDAVDPAKATDVKTASAAPSPSSKPESTPKTSEPSVVPVTITGCLERVDDLFRLKNTEGNDAPKSRTWKTGFLKRASTRIDVVDANRRWNLPGHVGQRVSVTGTLVDREMRIQSLSRVSSSCTVSSMAS